MENLFIRFVFLSSFFCIGLMVGVYASKETSGESYWQATLPETPIPKAVQELLHPENWQWIEGKSRYAGISKGVLNTNAITISPDVYAKAATGAIPIEKDVATFFLEKDLHSGQKMTLHFPKPTKSPHLLPRQVAASIPFSSSKLPQIQTRFALIPKSAESEIVKQTIQDCEEPSIEGEDKLCATSLESLVDFTVSKLGKNVEVYSTKVEKENKQEYNIASGVRKIGDKSVVCHKQNYLYAVFYCHELHATRAYMVSLVGADGSKEEAVAVCHTDSRKWKPKHLAFQLLKVKPGTVPICHFLHTGNLLWVPKLEKV